jgi:transcriptional regulator with XRE-family HTH domain
MQTITMTNNIQTIPGIQITLRSARANLYLTLEDVSKITGISIDRIEKLEFDCGKARMEEFVKLVRLYGLTSSHVFIGKESEAHQALQQYLNKEKSPSASGKIAR